MVFHDISVFNSNCEGIWSLTCRRPGIPALLIALSGVMKLTGSAQILETMQRLGVRRYVQWLVYPRPVQPLPIWFGVGGTPKSRSRGPARSAFG
jgi:hypothetical protein